MVCNTVVQIMQSFNWQSQLVEEGAEGTSILASIAHLFAILFIPLGFGVWQLAAPALAYLMFNLYTPLCFAALGAMNSEMKSGKWLFGGSCLQLATGYTVVFGVYQIGTLITTGSLGTAFVPGFIAVIVFALIVLWRIRKSDKEFASEYSLHFVRS